MIIAVCLLLPLVRVNTGHDAGASVSVPFRPQFTTLRVGLFFGSTALPSANLQNADGFGRGFDFGFFDSNRNFVPIGAWTNEHRITMLMARNVVWHPTASEGRGEFREGTSGAVVVGSFHVKFSQGFATFEEARTIASQHQGGFVRYQSASQDPFFVMVGNHTSRASAESALAAFGAANVEVFSGTQHSIKVVRTGTNAILFEFDAGTTPFGIMPRSIAGEDPETWFHGFRYHGGFSYARRDGGLLTVLNYVDIEDYVKGILPYEMSPTWPIEALKAQALTARTFAVRSIGRHASQGFDLCVDVHCQVYRGRGHANDRTDQAVTGTRGMYVTFEGRPAETVYASSNGGASENVENVWMEPRPYLRGVLDPWEAYVVRRIQGYNWTVRHTPAALTERLRTRISGFNLSTVAAVRVTERSATGNAIGVTITDVNGRTHTLRGRSQILAGLGTPTLRFDIGDAIWSPGNIFANSPAIPVNPGTQIFGVDGSGQAVAVASADMRAINGEGNSVAVAGEGSPGIGGGTGLVSGQFVINGTGNGHQVGMSQWGAFAMAHYHNLTFRDIIHFYFTNVEITETYQG